MDTTHSFLAQDQAGNRYRVSQVRKPAADSQGPRRGGSAAAPARDDRPVYQLEDGSLVRRVDNDTFQIVANGAYVSVVRD